MHWRQNGRSGCEGRAFRQQSVSTSKAFFFENREAIYAHIPGRNTIRGPRTTTIREEARVCAERMGYHWLANTEPDLPFDAFMFRQAVIAAVKVKKVRYSVDDDVIIEKKFSDEVVALQTLPLPAYVLHELWIRTQNERAWRRFYVMPGTTAEIEFNTSENYRNTHFDEEKWQNAPFRIDIALPPKKEG
jgi:hypothetical protein